MHSVIYLKQEDAYCRSGNTLLLKALIHKALFGLFSCEKIEFIKSAAPCKGAKTKDRHGFKNQVAAVVFFTPFHSLTV